MRTRSQRWSPIAQNSRAWLARRSSSGSNRSGACARRSRPRRWLLVLVRIPGPVHSGAGLLAARRVPPWLPRSRRSERRFARSGGPRKTRLRSGARRSLVEDWTDLRVSPQKEALSGLLYAADEEDLLRIRDNADRPSSFPVDCPGRLFDSLCASPIRPRIPSPEILRPSTSSLQPPTPSFWFAEGSAGWQGNASEIR